MEAIELERKLESLPREYGLQAYKVETAYVKFKSKEIRNETEEAKLYLETKLKNPDMKVKELECEVVSKMELAKIELLQLESDYRVEKSKLEQIQHELIMICKLSDIIIRDNQKG